jgi:hypothetical protein
LALINSKEPYYELVDYAPDGEGTRIIVSKKDCFLNAAGQLAAHKSEIEAHYR